jgi:hypothetical protein
MCCEKQHVQREVACVIVLNPADIIVGDRLRALDRESVERLKESISRIGLKTPISVRSSVQGWTLVAGRHRLAACIELGIKQIAVVVETSSELDARLWEIAENLHRAELTALERAEHVSQWIKLRGERRAGASCDQADEKLDQVGPVSELIPARGGRGREGGVRAAARELGISRAGALRAVQRVDRISPAVREVLREIPEIADNGVELDALAALPAEQQAAAVAVVQNGGAPSIRAAIATSARPTGRKAANGDNPLDAILEQIRRLGENERESLWDALAGQWHEEISRAFACRLLKTGELPRRETAGAGATPSDPDIRGGPVQAINGPVCERVYAIGSLEWAEQQQRQQNGV